MGPFQWIAPCHCNILHMASHYNVFTSFHDIFLIFNTPFTKQTNKQIRVAKREEFCFQSTIYCYRLFRSCHQADYVLKDLEINIKIPQHFQNENGKQ